MTIDRTLELRLYVVALLAVVYTVAWRAIGAHVAAAPPAPVRAIAVAPRVPTVVPRPRAQLSPARIVRVPAPRARRVRTRSS